jgi:hypothetical protein
MHEGGSKRQRCQSSEQRLEFFRRERSKSGGKVSHPAPKNPSAKLRWKSSRLDSFLGDQDGIPLIDYLPKGQTINAEYYSSLLVQLKDILKETHAKSSPRDLVLSRQCPGSLGTCNPEETGLPRLPVSSSPTLFSGSGPVGLHMFPGLKKTIETMPFFVRNGQFAEFLDWLANFRTTG